MILTELGRTDTLQRLTGERLVDAPRHEGFRTPLLSEAMLRHLYGWHRDILLLAIGRRRVAEVTISREPPLEERTLNAAFAALAEASGNPEHVAALINVSERLEPYRRFEREFLDATEAETNDILAAIDSGDLRRLRTGLLRYHRRRQRIVPKLLETAQAPS
jgi:DNA-binding GntR family transcriptional regulator